MTDNLDFFINYNTTGQTILDKYKHFTTKEYYINNELINRAFISFVFKLNYQKDASTFNLIHKVINTTNYRPDLIYSNLIYEFYVGRSINIIKQYLPNFAYTVGINLAVEPYHPGRHNDIELNNIQTYETFNFNNSKLIENGCKFNLNNGLMIEYLYNSKTFNNILLDPEFSNPEVLDYNLFTSLFQIYAALYSLKDIYAHQDLHLNNVMIITLPLPINITYNIDGREYVLFTKYIPVMIDYALSYINLDAEYNSQKFVDIACRTTCNKNHGKKQPCYLNENGMNNNNDPSSYNPEERGGKKFAKSLVNLNRTIDLYLIGRLMYEVQDEKSAQFISDEIPLKIKFKELFNSTTYPEWFITKYPGRVITSILKEYSPPAGGDPYPHSIRYTSDVITKFLIPYYNEHYRKEKNHIYGLINIDCTFGRTKWTNTRAAPISGAELLASLRPAPAPISHAELEARLRQAPAEAPMSHAELEARLRQAPEEAPMSHAELEASLRQAPAEAPMSHAELEARLRPAPAPMSSANLEKSFKPLTISPSRFADNKNEFKRILGTIEIRPANFSPAGGNIDAELSKAIELLDQIKANSNLSANDLQKLHKLFYNLTDKGIILREGGQITKEQIYKIMNDLFNYSAAVGFPGKRGGYYEKYMKYKAKYLRLKALGI